MTQIAGPNEALTSDHFTKYKSFLNTFKHHLFVSPFKDFADHTFSQAIEDGLIYRQHACPTTVDHGGCTIALFLSDRASKGYKEHDHHWAAFRRKDDHVVLAHKMGTDVVRELSPHDLFQTMERESYHHFAGYFTCPNDLGFPSASTDLS